MRTLALCVLISLAFANAMHAQAEGYRLLSIEVVDCGSIFGGIGA